MPQTFDRGKRVGCGNRQVWSVTVKNRFRITKKTVDSSRHSHNVCVCVWWQNFTALLLQFNFQFSHYTGNSNCRINEEKKTVRHASRPGESERRSWRPIFVMKELSSIYTQASIHCLHFTTATSIIIFLSAKITTLQRPSKPPLIYGVWCTYCHYLYRTGREELSREQCMFSPLMDWSFN